MDGGMKKMLEKDAKAVKHAAAAAAAASGPSLNPDTSQPRSVALVRQYRFQLPGFNLRNWIWKKKKLLVLKCSNSSKSQLKSLTTPVCNG